MILQLFSVITNTKLQTLHGRGDPGSLLHLGTSEGIDLLIEIVVFLLQLRLLGDFFLMRLALGDLVTKGFRFCDLLINVRCVQDREGHSIQRIFASINHLGAVLNASFESCILRLQIFQLFLDLIDTTVHIITLCAKRLLRADQLVDLDLLIALFLVERMDLGDLLLENSQTLLALGDQIIDVRNLDVLQLKRDLGVADIFDLATYTAANLLQGCDLLVLHGEVQTHDLCIHLHALCSGLVHERAGIER